MPPICMRRWTFASRRSSPAAWMVEAVSAVSQNACTDTRGAGAMNSSASAMPGASMWPAFSWYLIIFRFR